MILFQDHTFLSRQGTQQSTVQHGLPTTPGAVEAQGNT